MKESFIPLDILENGAQELGISLNQDQLAMFDKLARLLVETNSQINLTRIVAPLDVVQLHFLDSLMCLAAHRPKINHRTIDVGTGAGFPGLAIKIAMPELAMTLVDATGKKIRFVEDTIKELEIPEATTKCARAEDLGRAKDFRGCFGTVYARALAALPIVAELCLPLLRTGGTLVAQKAGDISDELRSSEQIITDLGGQIVKVVDSVIPGTDIRRKIVLVRKVRPTPGRFPRAYAEIAGAKKK